MGRREDAQALVLRRGWEIFPLRPRQNVAYKRAADHGGRRWGATRDPEEIDRDWERWPRANIGLPTGPENGIVVLDADTVEGHGVDGLASIRKLERRHGPLPETLTAESPSGSIHRYFRYPPGRLVRNSTSVLAPGVDVRGQGGMVVAPPSVRRGGTYRWVDPEAEVADMPDWLLALVATDPVEQDQTREISLNNRAPVDDAELAAAIRAVPNDGAGGWDHWNSVAMAIWRATDGSELGAALFDEWSRRCQEKYDEAETAKRWRVIGTSPPSRIGVGTIMWLADQHSPGWRKLHQAREAVGEDASEAEMGDSSEVGGGADDSPPGPQNRGRIKLSDFYANMEDHDYVFVATGRMWPAASINSRFGKIPLLDARGEPVLDDGGEPRQVAAAAWLDVNRPVEQILWAPGEDRIIRERHLADGGWTRKGGITCYNMYRPPRRHLPGGGEDPARWVAHVEQLYGEDGLHVAQWLAHRVQRPGEKVNHSLVMLGGQGIGKDTLLEPVKHAVGHWNFREVSPHDILSPYNGYMQSTILRINEARDLGDVNRYQFYERTKTMMAAPPDVLTVNEKYIPHRSVLNVTGVIVTTNRKDSLYLPEDDRRHFVAYSEVTRHDYPEDYWTEMWAWYDGGGLRAVVGHLHELDLREFDAKAPPPRTDAFWEIVESNRSGESSEMLTLVVALGNPTALTVAIAREAASGLPALATFYDWLCDRRNHRAIPRVMAEAGYVPVRNPDAQDGRWKVAGEGCIVYASDALSGRDRHQAAATLARRGGLQEPAGVTPMVTPRRPSR